MQEAQVCALDFAVSLYIETFVFPAIPETVALSFGGLTHPLIRVTTVNMNLHNFLFELCNIIGWWILG